MMSARLLPKLIIVSLMILCAQSFAQAQGRFRPLVLRESLHRNFQGQSQINLKKLFRDPGIRFKGMSVESISMVASSARGRAKTQLEINGLSQPIDRQTVPTYSRRIDFPVDPNRNVIGRHINSLKIRMRGQVFVESVELVLSRNGRGTGRSEVFELQLSDFINFGKTYKIRRALEVGRRHNGKKVEFVEVTGASSSGNAYAELLIEGRPVGRTQYFSRYQNTLRFQMPYNRDVLGEDLKGLQIRISGGGAHVTGLKMELTSRPNRRPGRNNPRVVEREVDLNLTGQQSQSLAQLIARQDMRNRRVKTVEVLGRSKQGQGLVQLCRQQRWGQDDCQRGQRLKLSLTRHSLYSGEDLGKIRLRTRGQIHIKRVVVTFERF